MMAWLLAGGPLTNRAPDATTRRNEFTLDRQTQATPRRVSETGEIIFQLHLSNSPLK